jgi:cell division protein FtsW
MMLISILPLEVLNKKIASWVFVASIGLQALVFTPLGINIAGNRNWPNLGLFTYPALRSF